MADFISNLLLRNGISPSTQTPAEILRPRLPSLFEESHGIDRFSIPQVHSTKSDILPRSRVEYALVSVERAFPTSRSTIMVDPVERKFASTFAGSGESPAPEQKILAFPQETPKPRGSEAQPLAEKVQTRQLRSIPDGSRRIAPPFIEGESTGGTKSAAGENRSFVAQENRQAPQADLPPSSPGQFEKRPLPLEKTRSSLQTENEIQPTARDYSVDGPAGRDLESFSTRVEVKPAIVMQPAPIKARAEVMQRSELPKDQESQRVVEIHIGRIEVRAAPPISSPKRNTSAAPVMSLDEYLHQRRGGDR